VRIRVAVGLHFLKCKTASAAPAEKKPVERPVAKVNKKALRRAPDWESGEALETVCDSAAELCRGGKQGQGDALFGGKVEQRRVPLNAFAARYAILHSPARIPRCSMPRKN